MIDTTKTGDASYRDLQKENALISDNVLSYYKNKDLIDSSFRIYNNAPTTGVANTGYNLGSSKYDKDSAYSDYELQDIENQRYQNQSTWDTLGNGLTKFVGKVGSTVVGTFAGVIDGGITAIAEGRWSGLWDNDVTTALAEFDSYMEDNFKNYQSTDQQNASWFSLTNFGSSKFWMDDVLTNAGFTVGAALSSYMTAGIGGAICSAFTKASKALQVAQKTSAFISSLASATGEGSVEAKQAQQEYLNQGSAIISQEFDNRRQALLEKYSGDIYNSGYQSELKDLNNKERLSMAQLQDESLNVGNMVLGFNQVLLTLDNLIQFGKGLKSTFANSAGIEQEIAHTLGSQTIKEGARDGIKGSAERMVADMAKNGGKATAEMIGKNVESTTVKSPWMGRTRAFLKNFWTEGSEEMNQQWITSTAQAYYQNNHNAGIDTYWQDRLGYSREDDKDFNNFGKALMDGLGKSWGDWEQYEQFFIGAMNGGLGMPGVRGRNEIKNSNKAWFNPAKYLNWQGGAWASLKEYNESLKNANQSSSQLNELLSSEKFWNKFYEGKVDLATLASIQARQDKAAREEGLKAYKDAEDDYFAKVFQRFSKAGKLEGLRAIYDFNRDLSDEDIDKIVKNSTTKIDGRQAKEAAVQRAQQQKIAAAEAISSLGEKEVEARAKGDKKNAKAYAKEKAAQRSKLKEAEKSLQEAMNMTTEDSYIGTYVDSKGNRKTEYKDNDAIRKELNHTSDALKAKLAMYEEAAKVVHDDSKGDLTNEEEEVLTYLAFKKSSSQDRIDKIFNNNKLIPKVLRFKNLKNGDNTISNPNEIAKALGLDLNEGPASINNNNELVVNTESLSLARKQFLFNRANSTDENNNLLNEDIQKEIANSSSDDVTLGKQLQELRDLQSLSNDIAAYDNKLFEYRLNKLAIQQDKQAAQQKTEQEQKKKETESKLNGKNSQTMVDDMIEGNLEDDLDLEAVPDERKQDYKDAQEIYKYYNSISEAIENSDVADEVKSLAQEALRSRVKGAHTLEEIINLNDKDLVDVNTEKILQAAGYDSMEDFREGYKASQEESDEELINDLKAGALKVVNEAIKAENESREKRKNEPSRQTKEEKEKDKQESKEEKLKDGVGNDGPVQVGNPNEVIIPMGELQIGSKKHNVRAVKKMTPGSQLFTLTFEYEKDGKFTEGFIEVDVENLKYPSHIVDKKGTPISISNAAKNGKVKVLRLESKILDGKVVHYAVLTTGNKRADGKYSEVWNYIKKKDGKKSEKTHKTEVYRSDKISNWEEALGFEKGTLSPTRTKGTKLKVSTKRDANTVSQEGVANSKTMDTSERTSSRGSWKSNTSEFYIHPYSGKEPLISPFHETEFDKNPAFHKAVHDYLTTNHAFENARQLKKGDKLHFEFRRDLNDSLPKGSQPVLLIVNESGDIVGDIISPNDSETFANYDGLKEFYDYAVKQLESQKEITSVESVSKDELNQGEPADLDERIAIRSSLSGNGDSSVFGKTGSDVWKHSIDGRNVGRQAGHLVPVVTHEYGGNQISIYNETSSRGGAISISLWRNPTSEEVKAIGELYQKTTFSGKESVDKFAQDIDNILHQPELKEVTAQYGAIQVTNKEGQPLTTKVNGKYIGQPQFGKENKPASQVLTTTDSDGHAKPDFELGVTMGDRSNFKVSTSDSEHPTLDYWKPKEPKAGVPYVLIHTSDPSRPWYPVPFLMDTFDINNPEIGNSDLYKVLVEQLGKLKGLIANKKATNFKDILTGFFEMDEKDVFVENKNGNTTIKYQGDIIFSISDSELNDAITSDLGKSIAKALSDQNLPINVNKKFFNSTFEYYDSEGNKVTKSYKELLAPLIKTNLLSNHTMNDFFSFNPMKVENGEVSEGKAKPIESNPAPPAPNKNKGTKDAPKKAPNGYHYYQDGESTIVCNEDKSPMSVDDSTDSETALTYVKTWLYGRGITTEGTYNSPITWRGNSTVTLDSKGKIGWGTPLISKNENTNKFIETFKSDQEAVNRSATDANRYEIGGENHKRLHAYIDEKYGDQVKISSEQKAALEQRINNLKELLNKFGVAGFFVQEADGSFPMIDLMAKQGVDTSILENLQLLHSIGEVTANDIIEAVSGNLRDKVTGMRGTRALRLGTAIDNIVRDFFNNNLSGEVPACMSREAYNNLIEALTNLQNRYGNKYSFVSDKLVASGEALNAKGEKFRIAGEIDLLAVNKETGEIEIWDIKTSSRTFRNSDGSINSQFDKVNPKDSKFTRSQREQYTIQLNAYRQMLEQKYGIKISALKILPFYVQYDTNDICKSVIMQDTIDLEMGLDVLGKPETVKADNQNIGSSESKPKIVPKKESINSREEVVNKLTNLLGTTRQSKIDDVLSLYDKASQEEKERIQANLAKGIPTIYKSKPAKNIFEYLNRKANNALTQADIDFFNDGTNGRDLKQLDPTLDFSKEYGLDKLEELFYKYNTDSEQRALADKVFRTARKLGFKVTFGHRDLGFNIGGRQDGNHLMIARITTLEKNKGITSQILLHETIHGVTSYVLDAYKNGDLKDAKLVKACQKLEQTWDALKNNPLMKGEYGITNIKEMVAEHANPEFREKSKQVGLWDAIREFFRELFNINSDTTADDLISSALDTILENSDKDLFTSYSVAQDFGYNEEDWNFYKINETAQAAKRLQPFRYINKISVQESVMLENHALSENSLNTKLDSFYVYSKGNDFYFYSLNSNNSVDMVYKIPRNNIARMNDLASYVVGKNTLDRYYSTEFYNQIANLLNYSIPELVLGDHVYNLSLDKKSLDAVNAIREAVIARFEGMKATTKKVIAGGKNKTTEEKIVDNQCSVF